MSTDKAIFTFSSVMTSFQEAMRSLAPFADRMHIPWREPENYENWDRIATALYHSFVVDSVAYAQECEGWSYLPSYDKRVSSYELRQTFVCDASEKAILPFVCLETELNPFDTCLFSQINLDGNHIGYVSKPFDQINWQVCSGRENWALVERLTIHI